MTVNRIYIDNASNLKIYHKSEFYLARPNKGSLSQKYRLQAQ